MEIFKKVTQVDFLGRRRLALIFSVVLIVTSIASLGMRGLNFGIDFTGGTLVELSYRDAVNPTEVRGVLNQAGIDDAIVQYFGTSRDIMIRLPVDAEKATADQSSEV
ncbi:MAG: protein translocase subunit SecF, partial [Arenicellales bacterium]